MSADTQLEHLPESAHRDPVVDIEMPPPSSAPIILAGGVAVLALGMVLPFVLPVGLIVALFGIWKMGHFPEVDMHPQWFTFLNDRKFGMWVFLASEVMFFTALIGAFVAFKLDDGFAGIHEELNVMLATVGTSALIVSSFAVVMAIEALQSNDRRVFFNWMGITLALGLTFVCIQALEWHELFGHHIDEKTLFGTAFYLTTGFHGLHVMGGVLWLVLLLVKARRGEYSADNHLGVELFGLYWHFVDIVWIVLFTVIYLIE
ncbi:MAG: heme-copper oxidase subunit III [Anaerolineae bacterium]|nr:heme-copper oxidase subunit III [Anaerolineae bacterium]